MHNEKFHCASPPPPPHTHTHKKVSTDTVRGLCPEGNLRFKIDWASLQLEGNVPFLLCFAYIRRGDVTEGFWRYEFAGLIQGGLIFGILRYFYCRRLSPLTIAK